MPEEDKDTKVDNASADHAYFTITPRIVWARSRSPYDFALWHTIKDIAGDSRECFISTPDLATLAMMSVGQVHDSRTYLIECGLLSGEVRRDPGYPLPVWHLSVPDLWAASTEWSIQHKTIRSRIDFKASQKEEIQTLRASQKAQKEAKKQAVSELSAGENELVPAEGFSPGEKPHTPGEKPHTPGEKPHTPGETKKIYKEYPQAEKKEEGTDGGKTPPPSIWGLEWQIAAGVENIQQPTEDELLAMKLANALELFPQNYKALAAAFILATSIYPIKDDVSGWCKAFRDQGARTGLTPDAITAAVKKMKTDGMTIVDPFSVMGTAGQLHIELSKKPKKTEQEWTGFKSEFADAMETPVLKERPSREEARRLAGLQTR